MFYLPLTLDLFQESCLRNDIYIGIFTLMSQKLKKNLRRSTVDKGMAPAFFIGE